MKQLLRFFSAVHAIIALLFIGAALVLIVVSAQTGWSAIRPGLDSASVQGIIEAVGMAAIAVVALQIAQTIMEEEVIREAHISAPTRVRRFLSRFLLVVVVALAIETLTVIFRAVHEDVSDLLYAAAVLFALGTVLAGWGAFVRLNRYAEELEPEALEAAKSEDQKLE